MEPGISLKLFYLDFTHDPFYPDNIDLTKVKVLEVDDSSTQSTLLEIKMTNSDKHHVQVRNVFAVDKIVSSSDPEYKHLFRGLATLQQAIYFYMEPMHSHLFLNRSKLNVPSALNGDPDTHCSGLFSSYSNEEGTNWMMTNFMNEFVIWDTVSLGTVETPSVSVLLNVSLLLRDNDLNYLILNSNRFVHIIRFLDESGDEVFNFNIRFSSISGSTVFNTFQLFRISNSYLENMTVEDTFDGELRLSLDSIFFNITKKPLNKLLVHVGLKGARIKDSEQVMKFTVENSSIRDIAKIQLGTKPWATQIDFKYPPFLLIVHDLQVFHGGYFFSNNANKNDLYALSMDEVINVHCAATPKVYRPSGNADLDSHYYNLLESKTNNDCTEFQFNTNCSKTNCEICIESKCLVCAPFYELLNGDCIGSFETKSYDLFNRKRLSELAHVYDSGMNKLENNKTYNWTYGFSTYAFIESEYASNLSIKDTIKLKLDNDFCHLPNNSISSTFIKERLFGNESMAFRGVDLTMGGHRFETFEHTLDLQRSFLGFNCNSDMDLLKGQKYSLFCPSKVVDFSSFDYFPKVVDRNTYPENTFETNIILSNFLFRYLLKCQNNCDCSNSVNNLGCSGVCPGGMSLVKYGINPLIEYCSWCSNICKTCEGSYCLVCDASSSYSKGKVEINGNPSNFEKCKPCHSNCTDGCTGPDEIDCKKDLVPHIDPSPIVPPSITGQNDNSFFIDGSARMVSEKTYKCRDDCALCDDESNCTSCYLYGDNVIYKLDTGINEFTQSPYFFCKKCESSCEVCSSSGSCICEKSLSNPFAFFDLNFNICRRVTCPENCEECDNQGLCVRCRDKYSLDDNKCVIPGRNCMKYSKEDPDKCDQCPSSFSLDSSSRCVRCSSGCDYCDISGVDSACLLCRSSILYRNQCISLNPLSHNSALQANINLLYSIMKNTAKGIDNTFPNCKTKKNKF